MKNQSADIFTSDEPDISFSREEALNIILNNLQEILILVDKQLRIVYTNEETRENVRKNYGIDIDKNTSVLSLVSAGRHQFMIELYKDVFEGRSRETVVEMQKDGKPVIFETRFKPARNSKGEIIGAILISKDVTELRQAENTLREAEERWRFALEGGSQAVWDWNVQTGDIFFSDSYKKLYGYSASDLKGKIEEWQNKIHPDDRKRMERATKEHIDSADPFYESVYRIKAKDGSYKWVLGRGMLIRDAEGKAQRMIGTHTDITKQVIAEKTYKLLFYSNPLPMWTYDLETLRFLAVNNAAIDHYGYSKEEFLSMTIKDIRPTEDIERFLKIVRNGKIFSEKKYEARHIKKNGEIIHVELSVHRLENTERDTVLVAVSDITAKLKAAEALKKSNERFLLAVRATSDAIYDWDLTSGELYWGEGLQTLFGYHPREVTIGMWENLVHPDDRQQVKTNLSATLADGTTELWKSEYRFAKADSSYSYVLERGFIIRDEEGRAIRMIGSLQDITERKYSEQILSLERSVFELTNRPNTDFKFIVETLLKGFEEIHEDAYTSLLLLKEDETVESYVAPRLPEEYTENLNGFNIGPETGSCGAAMYGKHPVIVSDIDSDPLWYNHKHLTKPYGLKACWSLPIIHSSGKVMGAFAVYYRNIKSPSSTELDTLERIRNILRILFEHYCSLEEIKKANERYDIVMKATHDLIWDWNLETNVIFRDADGLQKVYGISDNKSIENIQQWLSHIHPDDMLRVEKVITEILQTKEENIFEVEYRFKRNEGTYVHVYDRGMILRNEQGKPVRMIGAAQDITERKHLEAELLLNELGKQKAINQASVDSQEQERTEIGKELHDNVNQVLTTTKLYLDLALSNKELKDELIAKSNQNIVNVINEIRQLSRSLMDPTIGDLGLIDSLKDLIENINLTRKLVVTLEAESAVETFLNKNHKLTIFRIIQEALNNTIKHAKASTVVIDFRFHDNDVQVVITDNGIGFDPAKAKMGAGLKNIQNRVYLINGRYNIQTSPGNGCKIMIHFPIIK